MKEHEFTLILSGELDEKEADHLYKTFNDGTLSTFEGNSKIEFHRQADSLEQAIRSAIGDVRSAGIDIARVELEPDTVAHAS